MLNFIQLTRVPLCLSLVRSLSQQSSEVSSRVKWNESLFNCLKFRWKLLRFLWRCWIYRLMLGLRWKKMEFSDFLNPNETKWGSEMLTWNISFLPIFSSVTMCATLFSRQITTFIHLLFGFRNAATHTCRKPQDALVGVLLTFLLHMLGNAMNY